MSRALVLKGRSEVEDFSDLTHWVEALMTVDEVYRLMKRPDLLRRGRKIDFRTKEFKGIDGARLASFRVSSPPEVEVPVDNLWIGALVFVLLNYKNIKENATEIHSDSKRILAAIKGLAEDEILEIDIGVRIFLDHLLGMAEADAKGFLSRVQAARGRLNFETIEPITIEDNGT